MIKIITPLAFSYTYPIDNVVAGLWSRVVNRRPCRDELQQYDPKAVDVAERSQVVAGAVGRVQVAGSSFDLAADIRLVALWP